MTSDRRSALGETRTGRAYDASKLPAFEPPLDPRHLSISERESQRNAKLIHILSSAARVLARDGHAKLSLRQVAGEAGISLSSLQHYFETKEMLLVETIRMIMTGYLDRYDELRRGRSLRGAEALAAIFEDVAVEVAKPEVCGFFFEMWALARHEPQAGELLAEMYDIYRGVFGDLVREINPELPDAEVQAIATLIAAQTEGLLVMNYHGGGRGQLPATVMALIQTMWVSLAECGVAAAAPRSRPTASQPVRS